MTKEVDVVIEGFQSGQDESVITTASGTHHLYEGKHYIRYEDNSFDGVIATKNQIKISDNQIEITKKDKNVTRLTFDLKKKTDAVIQTPFGSMLFEVKTKNLQMKDKEDRLLIDLEYTLYDQGNFISDNRVSVQVISKG
jgi:uncharacterized beta-barrel protein YwiB (DUF1934 family)